MAEEKKINLPLGKKEEEKEKEPSKPEVPNVEVRSRGRVSRTLDYLAALYEAKHTVDGKKTRECRWAYDPEHRPELSNVIGRKMEGWKVVRGEDHPEAKEFLGLKDSDPVRNGDVVLVWTTPENRASLRKEIQERTQIQAERVEAEYYEATEQVRVEGMKSEHKVRPRGRSRIEEKEFEFEYTQKEG